MVSVIVNAHDHSCCRRKTGPPPTGTGAALGLRLCPEDEAALDAWLQALPEDTTRPEAIRLAHCARPS